MPAGAQPAGRMQQISCSQAGGGFSSCLTPAGSAEQPGLAVTVQVQSRMAIEAPSLHFASSKNKVKNKT